jgi:hypothetical protein
MPMSAAVLAREKKDEAAKAKAMDACRKVRYHSSTSSLLLYTHSLMELHAEEEGNNNHHHNNNNNKGSRKGRASGIVQHSTA